MALWASPPPASIYFILLYFIVFTRHDLRGGFALFAAPWGAYPHGTICEVAGRGEGPGASGAGRPRPLHPHARPTEAQLKSWATQSRRGSGAGSARARARA